MKQIFIGGAWPYANNSMHIGHLAALLPGDILARYFRKSGAETIYVSGSDCHGTPITVRSEKLGIPAENIAKHYDAEFRKNFEDLNFSYDVYTNTMSQEHDKNVKELLKTISRKGFFYSKKEEEDFCEKCNKFVSDRDVVGVCPICGNTADGDQCDKCLTALTPDMLKDKKCKKCGSPTSLRENTHLYFELSKLTEKISQYFEQNKQNWRQTAIKETEKYLKEGLRDRAITRSLNWGVDIPFEGFEDKKVYVWIEAVIGYLTAGKMAADKMGIDFDKFMRDKNTIPFYIHGKDNIVFHTIILPSLLEAIDETLQKPKMIISSEYINLNEEKMSKSKGNLVTVNTLLENFSSDVIRYYFIFNNPEKKDSSFSIDDFISINNKHLVGGLGNFVNRNLAYLEKQFNGILPKEEIEQTVIEEVQKTYKEVGELLEHGELKAASLRLFDLIQFSNKYYDNAQPWVQAKNDLKGFNITTSNCLYLIANISNLYEPIIPATSRKIKNILGITNGSWKPVSYDASKCIQNVPILFKRIKPEEVDLTKGTTDTFKKKQSEKLNNTEI